MRNMLWSLQPMLVLRGSGVLQHVPCIHILNMRIDQSQKGIGRVKYSVAKWS